MAALSVSLASEREEVIQFRRTIPEGRLLTWDEAEAFMDRPEDDERTESELLHMVRGLCQDFGLGMIESYRLILTGEPPKLEPVRASFDRHEQRDPGTRLRHVEIAVAPWVAPEDAATALREAQLRDASLRESWRLERNKNHALDEIQDSNTDLKRIRRRSSTVRGPRWRPNTVKRVRVRSVDDRSLYVFLFAFRRRAPFLVKDPNRMRNNSCLSIPGSTPPPATSPIVIDRTFNQIYY